ncbi:uncharacterized protein SPSK_09515 [Sporothrix schenckii 1099-18]|uniref:C2H2-type domain-containing protein n=1 Tax=Sporothrix schenckii 1099-18 TaxID=1397361 RepID=A0A0F2M6Z1_SPOSC|nr:uncharacterized protein SPSK_09515 [Sporothrix schenckii 1099-18]KJR85463.1 hypothetical protein SPSK_09515 [Sporothrix schenckii 1099-18]
MASSGPTARSFSCDPPCFRKFKTAAALKNHKRDARNHAQAGRPANAVPTNGISERKNRGIPSSGTGTTRNRHGARGATIVASTVTTTRAKKKQATKTSRCTLCDKLFVTDEALADHTRNSRKHNMAVQAESAGPAALADTPLDRFFQNFNSFPYDRFKPPAESFRQLERFLDWRPGTKARERAWARYQRALVDEVQLWYGDVSDIAAWHDLCRAIGIRNLPPTTKECKAAVRRTHVNIVDLIEWGRNGRPANSPVRVYRTVEMLRVYTMGTHRVFPRGEVIRKEDGATNIVLRYLLRDFKQPGLGWDSGGMPTQVRRSSQ